MMKIYRDRERDINFEEKEKQGVLLLVTKSAEVILHKSPTVPNSPQQSPTFCRCVAVWKAAAQACQSERRNGRLQGAFRSCFKGTMADVVGCNRGKMGYKFPMKYLEPGFNQPSK